MDPDPYRRFSTPGRLANKSMNATTDRALAPRTSLT